MLDLDDKIALFSQSTYKPKIEAQRYFASSSENEIQRKLNEMGAIQVYSFHLTSTVLFIDLTALVFLTEKNRGFTEKDSPKKLLVISRRKQRNQTCRS